LVPLGLTESDQSLALQDINFVKTTCDNQDISWPNKAWYQYHRISKNNTEFSQTVLLDNPDGFLTQTLEGAEETSRTSPRL
jgi:hypothetical protein